MSLKERALYQDVAVAVLETAIVGYVFEKTGFVSGHGFSRADQAAFYGL
jgi:hypothetical protein